MANSLHVKKGDTVKVISGDNAASVGAVTAALDVQALTLQARTLTGGLGTNQLDVARASVKHYRKKVSANRRRLTRAK